MKYFTGTGFYVTGGRYAIGSYTNPPAVLFFDTTDNVEFPEALESYRTLRGENTSHALARPVCCEDYTGWLFTEPLAVPEIRPSAPALELYYVADLADPASRVALDVSDYAYDACPRFERLMGQCPCPEGHVGGGLTPCAHELVFTPKVDVDLRALIRTERYGGYDRTIFDTLPARVGEFEYISGRYLSGNMFGAREVSLRHMNFSDHDIERMRREISEKASAGLRTRWFKKKTCSACVFNKHCDPWNRRHCASKKAQPRTTEMVRAEIDRRLGDYSTQLKPREGRFTRPQINFLLWHASPSALYEIRHSKLSSRKTHCTLGYFTEHGDFRVFAGHCERDRSITFETWDELTGAAPELLELFARWTFRELPEGFERDYAILTHRRYMTHRAPFHSVSLHLCAVTWNYGLDAYMGRTRYNHHYPQVSFGPSASEVAKYQWLTGEATGSDVPW